MVSEVSLTKVMRPISTFNLTTALLVLILSAAGVRMGMGENIPVATDAARELSNAIGWGSITNGVRAGALVRRIEASDSSRWDWRIVPAFSDTSTNDVLAWLASPISWRVELRGQAGRAMAKTRLGREWGRRMEFPGQGLQESGFNFTRANSTFPSVVGSGFKLTDAFVVSEPGICNLQVAWCGVIIVNGNKILTQFPPVSLRVEIPR
jgi:hypothetical protein